MLKIRLLGFFTLLYCFFACNTNPYWQGELLYNANCANCHMEDGSGLGKNIPPLAGADYLTNNRTQLGCIIRYGIQDTIVVNGVTYNQAMAGIKLEDVEIANILNYVFHAWGNELPDMTIKELEVQLQACE